MDTSFILRLLSQLTPFGFGQRSRRLQRWKAAAESCGLQIVETARDLKRIKARAGAVEVWIETHGEWGKSRIVVSGPAPPELGSLTVIPESRLPVGRKVEIGDRHFDDPFFITGPTRLVLALLGAEERRLILDANAKGGKVEISFGALQAIATDDEKVADLLPLLLRLGKRFDPAIDLWRRLVENALWDPEPGVRLQNLIVLVQERPEDPDTVEALARVLEQQSGEPAPAASRARGATGSPAAEPLLIEALRRDDAKLRVAAATALGRAGTAAAVLPLQEAAESSLLDLDLRRAARQAIAEIQSRVQGASPGQLSLAGGEAGQLSLAQEGGELSIAEDPAGQLSIGDDRSVDAKDRANPRPH